MNTHVNFNPRVLDKKQGQCQTINIKGKESSKKNIALADAWDSKGDCRNRVTVLYFQSKNSHLKFSIVFVLRTMSLHKNQAPKQVIPNLKNTFFIHMLATNAGSFSKMAV